MEQGNPRMTRTGTSEIIRVCSQNSMTGFVSFVKSFDCWAADIDLTCVSPWNSQSKNQRAGTLISPRHVLFAAHFPVYKNYTITFVDTNNTVITRTVTEIRTHADYVGNPVYYPDLTVGLLNADVPTNQISYAKVLPDNYADYIRTGRGLPCIRFDQEEKATVGDITDVNSGDRRVSARSPTSQDRLAFNEELITGDSGNPMFILLNNEPVLLTVLTNGGFGGGGTAIVAFKNDINGMMNDLSPGGYQLEAIDLSGFDVLPIKE